MLVDVSVKSWNSLGGWLNCWCRLWNGASFIFFPSSRNKMVISPQIVQKPSNQGLLCLSFLVSVLKNSISALSTDEDDFFFKLVPFYMNRGFSHSICVCSLQTDTTYWDLRPWRVCSTCTDSPRTANTGTGAGTSCKVSTSTPEWVRTTQYFAWKNISIKCILL